MVVPLRTIGVTPLQRAIAAAQNSRLGNGGSAHRLGGISGYVSHGHHAIFDRREFLRVGGYDESFSTTRMPSSTAGYAPPAAGSISRPISP